MQRGADGMTGSDGRTIRLLHVVATDSRRGAEVFASDLSRSLDGAGITQSLTVLRPAHAIGASLVDPGSAIQASDRHYPTRRFDVRILGALRRAVDEARPNVVLAHGGEPLKYSIPATVGRPARVIYRRIGSARGRTMRGIRLSGYRALMRRADRIVAVADAIGEETIDHFRIRPSRVVTIPNGVDGQRMLPASKPDHVRRALRIGPEDTIVISVGAFTWEKDPLAQLAVAERVVSARPQTRFLLVGDGPLRPTAEDAVRTKGLERTVRLLGARDDVPDLLSASDVLILTSRTEGMPGVLIEAGMVGLPAVAFGIGGVPEVVSHGVTGVLVKPSDVDGLAAAVLGLVDDEERRRSMGEAARRHCEMRFDIRGVADRYMELIEEVASSP